MTPYPTPEEVYGDAFPERGRIYELYTGKRWTTVWLAEVLPRIEQMDPE